MRAARTSSIRPMRGVAASSALACEARRLVQIDDGLVGMDFVVKDAATPHEQRGTGGVILRREEVLLRHEDACSRQPYLLRVTALNV